MRTRILLLTLLCALTAKAQLPTDFRSEQIYLSQPSSCLPGDTLFLEGQVTSMASDRFLPYSNYLYIECFNEQDSVLVRQKVSCKEKGYFSTHLPTEYEWPAGVYYLRAYTRLMRNFSSESFAQQPFLLGKEFPRREEQPYSVQCSLFPSGGKLVSGHPQTVAVHLTDECSYPVAAQLRLMSERGDTLGTVRTSASGMAQLKFIPTADVNYYLTGTVNGRNYRFPVPLATRDIKVQGSLNGKRLSYQVLNARGNKNILYTYDRLNGLTRTDIERDEGILMLDGIPEVITLFLTDADNRILSEYTLSGKQEGRAKMQAPETVGLHEAVQYTLPELPEGSKVMARIVPENDLLAGAAEKSLKYLSDYASPMPFPHHLYAADEAEFNNDLHTWLSTARFQRFNLKEALAKDTALYAYTPEQVLSFSGKIEKKNTRPLKGGQLVAYHTTNDYVYDVPLLSDSARFLMAVDDFKDGEEFFLQAITAKEKPDFANYILDEETYPALQNNRRYRLPVPHYADSEVTIGNTLDLNYTVDRNNERNYTLPNVTVKARLRTEKTLPTHKFYRNNYADRKDIEEKGYLTLVDILRSMTGITVGKHLVTVVTPDGKHAHEEWRWIIKSTRGVATLSGETTVPILIDGVRMDMVTYDHYMEMPAAEIESVQLLRAWEALAYTFGAINGAIIVKTRQAGKVEPLPSRGAMYSPMGLYALSYPYREIPRTPLTCDKPGRYRLLVDVIGDSGVRSYEHRFEAVNKP